MQMLWKNLFFYTLNCLNKWFAEYFSEYNDKNIPNKFIELNKFLNNVCIIRVDLKR
jgi:hypothetical protein